MVGWVAALALLAQDALRTGEPAPEFKLPRLDGSGEISLSGRKDKLPVALIFAKPGSAALGKYASAIEEVHKKFKDRVAFLLVYLGETADRGGLEKKSRELKLSMDLFLEAGSSRYVEGLYVVDLGGRLAWKSRKAALQPDPWKKEIEKLFAAARQEAPAPAPATSRGGGGPTASGPQKLPGGLAFELIVPGSSGGPVPVLIVFSGVEGRQAMAQNIRSMGASSGMANHVVAVLDGREAKPSDGVETLALLRRWYNVDNEAVKVFTESAGTRAGLTFALQLAQADIAAVWANDPVAVVTPSSAPGGFRPWGSAGAGAKAPGDVANARAIVAGMKEKSYRTAEPFIDPSSGHGTTQGFIEGLKFLKDKRRR
jgi:hypothetical protein